MTQTINEAKHILSEINSIEVLEQHELNQDVRKGYNKLLQDVVNNFKEQEILDHYNTMNKFESELLNNNPQALICGIDEVGRGPLAGPVVACAVILNEGHRYLDLMILKSNSE